ncbi:MAG: divergent polysaccharide deacetylase family protein [Fibromonadales bacterium]|nr:divergent polysaccharide deacetylase family protein [Fibromonadales bacterium]
MFQRIQLKVLVIAAVILVAVLIMLNFRTKPAPSEEPTPEANSCDVLLLNENLKKAINVRKEIKHRTSMADEIWLVPNGMSIPNYMLRASKEIERCSGRVLEMRELKNSHALLKYESEQGTYPSIEIRVIDSLWLPNSSKLAVVLAVRELNKTLKNNPEILEKLDFAYNLLIPSSRPELLDAGKKTNANIIPWIPMESSEMIYDTEKKSQISLGITTEKELAEKLDSHLKKFGGASGFAAFYGEDFLVHSASVEILGNVLRSKNLWFLDLTKKGTASLSQIECAKKDLKCNRDLLVAESETLINNALKAARTKGKAILLFEFTEKSIGLLENLPKLAEKQGTSLVFAEEVF